MIKVDVSFAIICLFVDEGQEYTFSFCFTEIIVR